MRGPQSVERLKDLRQIERSRSVGAIKEPSEVIFRRDAASIPKALATDEVIWTRQILITVHDAELLGKDLSTCLIFCTARIVHTEGRLTVVSPSRALSRDRLDAVTLNTHEVGRAVISL